MPAPSKEQIEAAISAFYDLSFKYEDLPAQMEAALTAAAEVGELDENKGLWPSRMDEAKRRHAAAAEVGLPTAQDVKGILRDDWLHAATIERCAQVAENYTAVYGCSQIAAAIRALKND